MTACFIKRPALNLTVRLDGRATLYYFPAAASSSVFRA